MAELTEEKRMEMEAEMNRFEQEILAPDDAPRMIIGANTFHKVQAALKAQHHPTGNTEQETPPQARTAATHPVTPTLLPPPPPPPILTKDSTIAPPPPPPPSQRPAFVPPQLRHRPPAPPPRFPPTPPMGMPRSLHPGSGNVFQPNGPPPPPAMFPNMGGLPRPGPMPQMGPGQDVGGAPPMGPRPPMGSRLPFVPAMDPGYYNRFGGPSNRPPGLSGLQETHSAVISKPKVVYTAPPVRNVPKSQGVGSGVEQGKRGSASVTVEKPASVDKPVISDPDPSPAPIGPAGATGATSSSQPQIPAMPDYSLQDLMEMPMDAELMPGHQVSRKEKKEKKRKIVRTAAGQCWEDQTLGEWENDDFRIFCGDLGNEVTDDVLAKSFSRYGSFLRAKVVRDKRTNKSKGYGFVSFKDPNDFVRAMREMNAVG
ncbi:RNA-binding protein 42-like isoform X2 [Liolophura sinensis]|uniref:RNA-binding protein 42-like isoform X2 n=1 Tax=Liolophura sinensis TaxID=3198878 RepID=UPI003158C23E